MVSTADPVREMQPIPPPPDYPPPEAPALSEERQQQMLKAHELKTTWSDEHAKYYDSVSRHMFVLFVTVILIKYNLTFTVIPLIFYNCSNPCRERHVTSVVLQNYLNHCREHHVKSTFTQNETNMKMVLLPDGFLGSLFYGSYRAAAKI